MAASTANRYDLGQVLVSYLEIPVSNVHIYSGIMVCTNASGHLVAAADTANLTFAGLSRQEVNNTAGVAGSVNGQVIPPSSLKFLTVYAANPDNSWIGKLAYVVDDHTVGLAATPDHDVVVGRVLAIVATGASGKVTLDVQDCEASKIGT